mgnify:CR=1 FL=1
MIISYLKIVNGEFELRQIEVKDKGNEECLQSFI